jgi:Butirosin biosynthesis protein H, N-terminal
MVPEERRYSETSGREGMFKPFPGFASYTTHHCVSGSPKHVYDFHGFALSEDLLLGLGSGLGFVYFHITRIDPFYGGRGNVGPRDEGLEKTVGRRTGVVVESHTTSSAAKAEASLQTLLEAHEPVSPRGLRMRLKRNSPPYCSTQSPSRSPRSPTASNEYGRTYVA